MGKGLQGVDFLTIRGKRRSMGVKQLTEKARRGRFTSEDRAYVRVGNMTTRVLIGMEDLSEWDDDELKRGRRRDKNGGWAGRDPVVIPKAIFDEIVKRTMDKARSILQDNLEVAVIALTEIVAEPKFDAKDRLRAIEMVLNRTMGKEPVKVEVTGTAKWELALAGGIKSMKSLEDGSKENRDDGEIEE